MKKKVDLLNINSEDEPDAHSILINGNVPCLLEYEKDKIVLVGDSTVWIVESWETTKSVEISLSGNDENYFTMANKNNTLPMGFIRLVPGYEEMPLIVVGGSEAIFFVNPNLGYFETFILAKNTSCFS